MRTQIEYNKPNMPLQKRMKELTPFCDNLYPHEVLILWCTPKWNNKENHYASYWEDVYGITNKEMNAIVDSLLERKYIEIGTIKDAISLATIKDIEVELRKRELPLYGKKSDLINRLLEKTPSEELSQIFNRVPYRHTLLGEQVIKKYEWVHFIHKKMMNIIDLWEFSKLMAENPTDNYIDNIWIYLEGKGKYLKQTKDYNSYQANLVILSTLAYDAENYIKSFEYLCKASAYDLTNNSFNNDDEDAEFEMYISYKYHYNPDLYKIFRLNKYVELMNILGWTADELRARFVSIIASEDIPIRLFTPEQYGDILIAEMDENSDKIREIYKTAQRSFESENHELIDEIDSQDLDLDIVVSLEDYDNDYETE